MAVLAEDTFTGVDETTLSGRTPTGTTPGTGWNAASGSLGNWQIQSNAVRCFGGGWAHQVARLAAGESYPADQEVSATIAFDADLYTLGMWGLRVRQGDSGVSGYGVTYMGWVDQWALFKGDHDDEGAVLDTWSDTPDGNTRSVRLRAEGTTISVWIDDVLRMQETDSTYSSAGQPALHVFGEGVGGGVEEAALDNFQIHSLEAPDETPPTLSSASASATGQTTGSGSVSTDEGNGTLYWVVTTSSTSPSAAQVQAGQTHTGSTAVDSGSQAVSGTGVQNVSGGFTGLTASTTYYAHYCHVDAAANESSVATSSSFTTTANPPVISGIDPAEGSESGGTAYEITGTGFHPSATVEFGSGNFDSGASVDSSTSITGTTPSGTPGDVDVIVTNPDEQYDTLEDGFEYTADPEPPAGIVGPATLNRIFYSPIFHGRLVR